MGVVNWESLKDYKVEVLKLNEINDVFDSITKICIDGTQVFWRGQSDSSWKIESSIQRKLRGTSNIQVTNDNVVLEEKRIIQKVKEWGIDNAYLLTELSILSYLQHHGGPTRLIDVTTDPFVALFFACNENESKDGIVFAFDLPKNIRKYTVENVPMSAQSSSDGLLNLDIGVNFDSIIKEVEKTEMPAVLTSHVAEARIKAQKALFLFGYCGRKTTGLDYIDAFNMSKENKQTHLKILIVSKEIKKDIIKILRNSMGIDYNVLFPDFDGISKHLNK